MKNDQIKIAMLLKRAAEIEIKRKQFRNSEVMLKVAWKSDNSNLLLPFPLNRRLLNM